MRRETLIHISSLALAVALLSPIWGLVSPALGIAVAPVALWGFEHLPLPPKIALFVTLFVLGGASVIIGTALRVHVPSMLTGWAIGLTVMGGGGLASAGTLPLELAAAMTVGVLYAGWGVDTLTRALAQLWRRGRSTGKETNVK